ncbi:EAL domain-containing protein [Mycobacterium sp. PS03-16]|uniref:sensor domain-containing phosphodiesterase n=1 Tax=Mycobacterium sp. PS03-16 TaxID=2559611 RepID=UPI001073036C|nr:EAL domain-containing protein [Mycobacterium sp. PS03-16]TFV61457.1 EAL domain-containing protein [Mycobacterium sp. PS03-16]
MATHGGGAHTSDELTAAAAGFGITSLYQPIVSLPDGRLVGFEALARWPGLDDPDPGTVFSHAAATGRLDGLDRACIHAAIGGALAGDLSRGSLLLVNAEPATSYRDWADDDVMARGREELAVMFEITERSLLEHPQTVLRKVAALREDGFGVALDDVGVHPDSLALLDVISPDVIKLDIDIIQSQPRYDHARTLSAVLAHHERTGAVILAEGIETDDHLEQALAMGATLGQGFRFGRAGALAGARPSAWTPPERRAGLAPLTGSPFDLVAQRMPTRTARKQTLMAFTRHLESQAMHLTDPPMVLAAVQRSTYFTGRTADTYRRLAEHCPLVAVFGENLPADLGANIRGVQLDSADPLCAEWTVLVLGPHHAAGLLARELPDGEVRDAARRFEFAITYDRSVVTVGVRNLLDRMR